MEHDSRFWFDAFSQLGALWVHDGNPKRPHALLTSGKHSNGFFNASKVVEYPQALKEACFHIFTAENMKLFARPMIVIGSALGAITIAHVIAELFGARCGFTEPDIVVIDGEKQMVLKRFSVNSHDRVLVVEDVITTGDTTRKTIDAIEKQGAEVLPVVCVLVNRSGMSHLDGRRILALIDHPMPMWKPDECPLCKAGSEAVRPKGNWDKLNGEY